MRLLGVWLLCYALAALIYTPYLGAPYFSDDFLFFFTSPPGHLYQYLWTPGAAAHLYRPAEAAILTLIQRYFRFNTLPIHLISIAAHASLCCMVWFAAIRLGLSRLAAAISVLLMLVCQTSAPAMLGNDAMSQAMSAALGAFSVLLLAIAFLDGIEKPDARFPRGLVAASAAAYFCALLFKETAFGLILILASFPFLLGFRKSGWRAAVTNSIRVLIPYALVALVYLALRLSSGRQLSGSGIYRVGAGWNVVRNLAQFAVALLTPVSSVTAAVAAGTKDLGVLGWTAAATLFVAGVILLGLRNRPKGLAAMLLFSIGAAAIPAILLQHVSELYVYNAEPYAALLFGLALANLWSRAGAMRAAAILCLALMLGGGTLANRQKAYLMNANGDAAKRLIASLAGYIRQAPPDSQILLTGEPDLGPRYSVYLLRGLDVLEFGCEQLGPILGRPDVIVHIVPMDAVRPGPPDPRRLVLELRDGAFHVAEFT